MKTKSQHHSRKRADRFTHRPPHENARSEHSSPFLVNARTSGISGTIVLMPMDIPNQRGGGVEVAAQRMGKCTYVPMPDGTMLPCLNAGEKVVACLITLNTPVSITVDEQGDIGRTDFEKQTTTVYKDGQPVEVIDLRDVMPTEDDLSRFFEGMVELSGARRGRR